MNDAVARAPRLPLLLRLAPLVLVGLFAVWIAYLCTRPLPADAFRKAWNSGDVKEITSFLPYDRRARATSALDDAKARGVWAPIARRYFGSLLQDPSGHVSGPNPFLEAFVLEGDRASLLTSQNDFGALEDLQLYSPSLFPPLESFIAAWNAGDADALAGLAPTGAPRADLDPGVLASARSPAREEISIRPMIRARGETSVWVGFFEPRVSSVWTLDEREGWRLASLTPGLP